MLDHMNHSKPQIGVVPALDHMNHLDSLEGQLKVFLLSCRVDELSPNTLYDYNQKIGAFARYCNTVKPRDITANHVRLFLVGLQARCTPHSVKDYYGCVNRFFNWMVAEGTLERNPMASMHPPRVPKKIIQPFKMEQIRDLLLLCDENRFLGARNKAIILTFLDTGLRLTELANIQLADVDFERETIKVMGKGAKERVVRIGKRTQKAILRYLLMRKDDHPCLWVTEERRPLRAFGVQTMIKRLGRRAGINGVRCSPHTFRHTAAINFLRNGGAEFPLQCMLGHSTLQMTRKYVSSLGQEDMIKAHRLASPVDNMRL
jgi:integrase/recombinase XerC